MGGVPPAAGDLSGVDDGVGTGEDPSIAAVLRDAAAFCEAVGLDFGALDVLHDDAGRHYIIDMNVTPWSGTFGGRFGLAEHLREGFAEAVPQRAGT